AAVLGGAVEHAQHGIVHHFARVFGMTEHAPGQVPCRLLEQAVHLLERSQLAAAQTRDEKFGDFDAKAAVHTGKGCAAAGEGRNACARWRRRSRGGPAVRVTPACPLPVRGSARTLSAARNSGRKPLQIKVPRAGTGLAESSGEGSRRVLPWSSG